MYIKPCNTVCIINLQHEQMENKTYTLDSLEEEKEKRFGKALKENHVFFAFSTEQLEEGKKKHNIKSNKEIYNLGSGAYVPKKYADSFSKEIDKINDWYKSQERKVHFKVEEKEITEEEYNEALNVLSPIWLGNGAFQVSEPHDHITRYGKERARYATYAKKDNDSYYYLGVLTTLDAKKILNIKTA